MPLSDRAQQPVTAHAGHRQPARRAFRRASGKRWPDSPRGAALGDSRYMRALPVRPEPLWLIDFRQRIAASLWFVPTIFAVAAIALADLSLWLDAQLDAPIGVRADLAADPNTAATFSGAIAAATLA